MTVPEKSKKVGRKQTIDYEMVNLTICVLLISCIYLFDTNWGRKYARFIWQLSYFTQESKFCNSVESSSP